MSNETNLKVIHDGTEKYDTDLIIETTATSESDLANEIDAGLVKLKNYDGEEGYASIDSAGFVRVDVPDQVQYELEPGESGELGGVFGTSLDPEHTKTASVVDGVVYFSEPTIPDVNASDLGITTDDVTYNEIPLTEFLDALGSEEIDDLNFKGVLNDVSLLPDPLDEDTTARPNALDFYLVGSNSPYTIYIFSGIEWIYVGGSDVPSDLIVDSITASNGYFDNIYDSDEVDNLLTGYVNSSVLSLILSNYVTQTYLEENYPTNTDLANAIAGFDPDSSGVLSVNGISPDEYGNVYNNASNIEYESVPDGEIAPTIYDVVEGIKNKLFNYRGVIEDFSEITDPNTGDVILLLVSDISKYSLYVYDASWKLIGEAPFELVESVAPVTKVEYPVTKTYGTNGIIVYEDYGDPYNTFLSLNSDEGVWTATQDCFVDFTLTGVVATRSSYLSSPSVNFVLNVNGEVIETINVGVNSGNDASFETVELVAGDIITITTYCKSGTTSTGTILSSAGASVVAYQEIKQGLYNTGVSLFGFDFGGDILVNVADTWTDLPINYVNRNKWNSNYAESYGVLDESGKIILGDEISDIANFVETRGEIVGTASAKNNVAIRVIAIDPVNNDGRFDDVVDNNNIIILGESQLTQDAVAFNSSFITRDFVLSVIDDEGNEINRDGYEIYVQYKSDVAGSVTITAKSGVEFKVTDIRKR